MKMELNCEFINTFTFIIETELTVGHSSIFHCTVLYLHTLTSYNCLKSSSYTYPCQKLLGLY